MAIFNQQFVHPRVMRKKLISYYSGHYESYGLNCQAVCYVRLRFLVFGVIAPGSTNYAAAFPPLHRVSKGDKKSSKRMLFCWRRSIHVIGNSASAIHR
mmetsp:Transcript_29069/g.33770  ORF Transcript_29069/g.33770 Transcript_29069/m.33770 type:complete len:98 (+) Transcript_29069:242-535(+)